MSEDCECHFGVVVQCALPRLVFDYAPIILDRGGVKKGTTPFRFKIMWLKEKGFKDLLKSWWEGYRFS